MAIQGGAIAACPHILIVEDDVEIALMLVELARDNGFEAMPVGSGGAMDKALRQRRFDLVILDGMLPGEDGFSICRRLRAAGPMPILMLTALREDVDRIIGLELGADDYVTKPFNSRELIARVKALLRRASYGNTPDAGDPNTRLTFADWIIDPKARQVLDPEGAEVLMTTAEFDLLLAFCRNPNRILAREQLLAMTHAGSAGPIERSVDAHISRLRQKIEPNLKEPSFIKTVRLGGYMFAAKVEELP
ncbi:MULTISPECIES: response regulator transcription factor [unclassified Rhizobium]|jgi:two-component system OmpR family response regulator|uniref:response regulator n=1 Tax=unclassified Rhizobium TaxID=2613769 RepID=UPI0006469C00|nr:MULTISPECIES: response regulator transcription factor [unclassified Rhizobium]OJY72108.1 MAG: DNA-binding response regulator [Rhizobium sp. 60-20]RKD36041.1 two-component system OmpR family response regulator [Rhizobium sp. WW_1]